MRGAILIGGGVLLSVSVGAVGLGFCPVVNDDYPRAALYAAVGAVLIAAPTAFVAVRMRARGPRPMSRGERWGTALGLLLPAFFLGSGLVLIANAVLDSSPAVAHPVQVVSTHIARGDDSSFVIVNSWRKPGTVLVSAGPRWDWRFIQSLRAGQTIVIETRAGALGLERLAGVRAP
jgi:hypothetical protein